MFRALLLSAWYDLSDVKLAEALDDGTSFRRFLRLLEERGDAGAHGIRALPPGTGPSASRYPSRGLFMLLIFWGLGAAWRDFPLKETT